MKTYLLTWNPKRFDWDMEQDLNELKSHGFFDGRWSCGRTKRIESGDRLFLLRQGQEPRGIVASGYAKSSPHTDVHWDESRSDEALYVEAAAVLKSEGDAGRVRQFQLRGWAAFSRWRKSITSSSNFGSDPGIITSFPLATVSLSLLDCRARGSIMIFMMSTYLIVLLPKADIVKV